MLPEFEFYDQIPVPLIVSRGDDLLYVNDALVRFIGVARREIEGTSIPSLLERFTDPGDLSWVAELALRAREGRQTPTSFWLRLRPENAPAVRVCVRHFRPTNASYDVSLLIDAESEVQAVQLTEALVRASGELVRLRDEEQVLEAAVNAIHGQGFMVTMNLVEGELVTHGPSRYPADLTALIQAHYGVPTSELRFAMDAEPFLAALIRERRSAFIQDTHSMLDRVWPPELAAKMRPTYPRRAVVAAIHVDDRPYALLTAHSDELRPTGAAAIELFTRHIGGAVENVRHHARATERLKQLVQLQKDLVERERLAAVGEAAAVLSHEMRNPLGAILNAVTMLKRDVSLKGTSPALLAIVEEEATHLDRLVSDLLQFARPLEPRLRKLDVGQLTRSLADRTSTRSSRPLRIDVVCESKALELEADPNLMQLAIENLLRNAAQVSPPSGHVRVQLDEIAGALRLAVEDQGPGVNEADTRRIFEPFFTTRASGAGLGLAVVKRVVEAHGGEIRVGRSSLGGARFELLFPPRS